MESSIDVFPRRELGGSMEEDVKSVFEHHKENYLFWCLSWAVVHVSFYQKF